MFTIAVLLFIFQRLVASTNIDSDNHYDQFPDRFPVASRLLAKRFLPHKLYDNYFYHDRDAFYPRIGEKKKSFTSEKQQQEKLSLAQILSDPTRIVHYLSADPYAKFFYANFPAFVKTLVNDKTEDLKSLPSSYQLAQEDATSETNEIADSQYEDPKSPKKRSARHFIQIRGLGNMKNCYFTPVQCHFVEGSYRRRRYI